MNENAIRSQAIIREKDAQLQSALTAVCAVKGELAVANAKIEALTAEINRMTAPKEGDQPTPAEHKAPNGLQ